MTKLHFISQMGLAVVVTIGGFVRWWNLWRTRKEIGLSPQDLALMYAAGGPDRLLAKSRRSSIIALLVIAVSSCIPAYAWHKGLSGDSLVFLSTCALVFAGFFGGSLLASSVKQRAIADKAKASLDY